MHCRSIQRERDKPRLSLKNNTAGVREREDANRTRAAGNRDEVEGVVASTVDLPRNGAVGFIDWLDLLRCPNEYEEANQSSCDNSAWDHIWRVARFWTALREINHETEG